MEEHGCFQAEKIGKLDAGLNSVSKEVFGFNGIEGLSRTIPKLCTQVENLDVSMKDLNFNVNKLIAIQNKQSGEEEEKIRQENKKERQRLTNIQITGITIASIISAAGVIISLIWN